VIIPVLVTKTPIILVHFFVFITSIKGIVMNILHTLSIRRGYVLENTHEQ
jgi:hypothetical protein